MNEKELKQFINALEDTTIDKINNSDTDTVNTEEDNDELSILINNFELNQRELNEFRTALEDTTID